MSIGMGWSPRIATVMALSVVSGCSSTGDRQDSLTAPASLSGRGAVAKLLEASPPLDGLQFDPVHVLRCSNHLRGLGHGPALDALDAFIAAEHHTENYGVFAWESRASILPVLRCAFVRRHGEAPLPAWHLGLPDPWSSNAPTEVFPCFPVVLVNNIPFMLVESYSVAGSPQSPGDHVVFCRLDCIVRPNKLVPTTLPTDAAIELESTINSAFLSDEDRRKVITLIRVQALRALGPDYWTARGTANPSLAAEATNNWKTHVEAARELKVHWSVALERFTMDVAPDAVK